MGSEDHWKEERLRRDSVDNVLQKVFDKIHGDKPEKMSEGTYLFLLGMRIFQKLEDIESAIHSVDSTIEGFFPD